MSYDVNYFQSLYNAGALPQLRTPQPSVIHTHSTETIVREVPAQAPTPVHTLDTEKLAKVLDPLAQMRRTPVAAGVGEIYMSTEQYSGIYLLAKAKYIFQKNLEAFPIKAPKDEMLGEIDRATSEAMSLIGRMPKTGTSIDPSERWKTYRDMSIETDAGLTARLGESIFRSSRLDLHAIINSDALTAIDRSND